MKKLVRILLVIGLTSTIWYGCKDELPGELYGDVTDKTTGEPIKSASVELQPIGLRMVTGMDGRYGFNELEPSTYKLYITKTGYEDCLSSDIVLKSGQSAWKNIPLEKLPPSLRVVNNKREDIAVLDFGLDKDDITRSFNIFNAGIESLQWEITITAKWIVGVSRKEGELPATMTQSIVLTINRDSLESGENVTTVHITSNNGSKELKVKALGEQRALPVLNTLEATDVKRTSAILHGVLTNVGTPEYTERGFVYSLSSMPTLENTISKLTVAVTDDKSFQVTVADVEEGKTYYARAYAINKAGVAYSSNEVRFVPLKTLPEVTTEAITHKSVAEGRATLNANVVEAGEPGYTERGFVYGTAHNPMVGDATKKSVAGSGIGSYAVDLTDLVMGEIYYVRAYAVNEVGTAYGNEIEMDFHAVLPEVKTLSVSVKSISDGTAVFAGTIVVPGDPVYTERGFVWGKHSEPTIDKDEKQVVSREESEIFTLNVFGLEINENYYVRAYASTETAVVYGTELELDFNPILPEVKTLSVTDVDGLSATLRGIIESIGDPAYTEAGFVYGTMQTPSLDDASAMKVSVAIMGAGNYSKKIEHLKEGETYYVRAYIRNEYYTVYGTVYSFQAENPYYIVLPAVGLMVQRADLGYGNCSWETAEALCGGSDCAGYTDWRLPTKDEMMVIYNNKKLIGKIISREYYWTSTLCEFEDIWGGVNDGHYSIHSDYGSIDCERGGRVRAVRTITK